MSVTHERARVASLTRSRAVDDPDLVDAKRSLAAENIAAFVQRAIETAPPLTYEQRVRIAQLLRPTALNVGRDGAA